MLTRTPELAGVAERLRDRYPADPVTGCRVVACGRMAKVKVPGIKHPPYVRQVLYADLHGFLPDRATLQPTCGTKFCVSPEHRIVQVAE